MESTNIPLHQVAKEQEQLLLLVVGFKHGGWKENELDLQEWLRKEESLVKMDHIVNILWQMPGSASA